MANGLPYDSDAGRDYAAAITALMHGEAYLQSSRIAAEIGPCAGFPVNRDPFLGVISMHRQSRQAHQSRNVPENLWEAAKKTWDECLASGMKYGYRNAQVTVLAPTGTIGFMMDCDTTGDRAGSGAGEVQEAGGWRADQDCQQRGAHGAAASSVTREPGSR